MALFSSETALSNTSRQRVSEGIVECDEVYTVAGHKGQPSGVKKTPQRTTNRLKGARGRGTLAKEKPPIFGMIQRGGQVGIRILEDVRQTTSQPLI